MGDGEACLGLIGKGETFQFTALPTTFLPNSNFYYRVYTENHEKTQMKNNRVSELKASSLTLVVPWWPYSMPKKYQVISMGASPPIHTLTSSFIEGKDESSEATESGLKPMKALST